LKRLQGQNYIFLIFWDEGNYFVANLEQNRLVQVLPFNKVKKGIEASVVFSPSLLTIGQ
jgi:hypothetical protein